MFKFFDEDDGGSISMQEIKTALGGNENYIIEDRLWEKMFNLKPG